MPHLIWRALSNSSFGDNLTYLITRAKVAGTSRDPAIRMRLVRACADHLYLLSRQHFNTSTSPWSRMQECLCSSQVCGHSCVMAKKRMCNHSAVFYILVKLLYIINCVGQMFIVIQLLGADNTIRSNLVGFSERLLNLATNKHEWGGSKYFPHQALCPIHVPYVGVDSHLYTAICAVPVNVLHEKLYLFLWVWILAVLTVTLATTIAWIWRLLIRSHSNSYLRSFLYVSMLAPPSYKNTESSKEPDLAGGVNETVTLNGALVERFLTEVVGCDGNFLIRMLRLNAGVIITGEILVAWWRMFRAMESADDDDVEDDMSEYDPALLLTFDGVHQPIPMNRMVKKPMTYI